MAINFPNNPNPNDTHSSGGKTWIWDGTSWKLNSTAAGGMALTDLSVNTASVGTAALSYNNSTGVFTYTPPDLSGYLTQQYTLPTASTTVLGGVKIDGSTITINNGVISGASAYNNGDLDARLNTATATSGQILSWTGTDYDWVAESVPTSITVANEGTDTTCYPLFSTDTTGNIAPKTVTSFKLNSQTGQVEAGSFKKTGGTSSEFLKADGSIDSSTYITSVAGVIPIGGIIMWSGSVSNIPSGWALCDGNNNTPDLRNRFVVGVHSDGANSAWPNLAPNHTGGDKDAVVVEHSHTTNIDGGHVIPGNGGSTYAYGGAGTYSSTVFSMQNEGVSGTNKNLPPYHALCYIMRTS